MRLPFWIADTALDLRFAVRAAMNDRALTLVAVGTLAVSIGLNATLFAIVSGMDNTPPVDDPARLVAVDSLDAAGRSLGVSPADFADWRREAHGFDALAATTTASMTITDADRPAERFAGAYVSAETFALVGERPILGRDFLPQDDRAGAEPVAIIGASVWRGRYNADAAVIGRSITINGVAAVIVGVMRDGFRFPLVHDVWQPLATAPATRDASRDARMLRVVGRLAAGVSIDAAQSELSAIAARLAESYPATNANVRAAVEPFAGRLELTNPWTAMLLAVSIVLLIACANIANLLLSRAAVRSRDMAIRASLGATRWRIVRQLLVESLLLGACGGVAGVALALVGVRLWVASLPAANWPYWYHFAVDRHVLAYIAEVAIGTALLFGAGPAVYLSSRNPAAHLHGNARGAATTTGVRRWSDLLLAIQFAVTLALLAGAGLLARTLFAVYRADAIVDTRHVLLAGVDLPAQRYRSPQERSAFYPELESRVATLRSVQAASLASGAPFYTAPVWTVTINGEPDSDRLAAPTASYVAIGPRYFDALALRVVRGRAFSDHDGVAGAEAAIVNELFASRYLRGRDPIGRRIRIIDPSHPDAAAPWMTIVGVTPTVRQHYAEPIDPVVYVPYRSNSPGAMVLLTRVEGDPASLAGELRDQLRRLDPDLPLHDIRTLDALVSGTRFANQVFAAMFAAAAALGLLLAAVGLYAVTAYAVVRRTAEIGVRMALGARDSQVVWLFARRTAAPLAVGWVAGLGGALAVGRLVAGLLVGTAADDPATLAAVSLALVACVVAASLLPSLRAARVDPAIALRVE